MRGNIHSLYVSANNYSPPLPLIHRLSRSPFPAGEGKKGFCTNIIIATANIALNIKFRTVNRKILLK